MHIKNIVSPIALAVALSFAGGASAQTMVGGVDVPNEDLPEVQNLCNSLAAGANDSLAETNDSIASGNDDDDDDDGADAEVGQADPDPAADDGAASDLDNAVTTIDLDTITLADCTEAGLVDTARVTTD
ncbi:MAG TPA: hypothetical protein VGN80_10655 [Devosiaceae bacterium]|jgi:hypothetical protein|nr:hypothetical protein [Devosiaceae bacterium]